MTDIYKLLKFSYIVFYVWYNSLLYNFSNYIPPLSLKSNLLPSHFPIHIHLSLKTHFYISNIISFSFYTKNYIESLFRITLLYIYFLSSLILQKPDHLIIRKIWNESGKPYMGSLHSLSPIWFSFISLVAMIIMVFWWWVEKEERKIWCGCQVKYFSRYGRVHGGLYMY